ncbi:hypothetical protein B0F90DRAFT_1815324 [Multifurca ochricompacta]|uniref:Uncharacterized protein n=1 Tax=Multifurca ochricompacta TaxID=376703 RepID=A0AAD4M8H2_9AGAM|nr:hypothetical protein B0F90DRAFT_1815324 [Multifurca ochricompacta]
MASRFALRMAHVAWSTELPRAWLNSASASSHGNINSATLLAPRNGIVLLLLLHLAGTVELAVQTPLPGSLAAVPGLPCFSTLQAAIEYSAGTSEVATTWEASTVIPKAHSPTLHTSHLVKGFPKSDELGRVAQSLLVEWSTLVCGVIVVFPAKTNLQMTFRTDGWFQARGANAEVAVAHDIQKLADLT